MLSPRRVTTSHEVGGVTVVTCNLLGIPTGHGSRREWGFWREIAKIAVRQKPGDAISDGGRAWGPFGLETATGSIPNE